MVKKRAPIAFCAALALALALAVALAPVAGSALDGVAGFEGTGISSGHVAGRATLEFSEYIFVTGEPILLKGTIAIAKTSNGSTETTSLSYKLSNVGRKVQLTRELTFTTEVEDKGNGQVVTTTALARDPSEKIVTDGDTYTLRSLDFTRTSLIDTQPAVSYYSGNTWYRKSYEVGGGASTTSSGRFVDVEAVSSFYGFDQAWGRADVEETDMTIEYSGAAGGTVAGAGGSNGGPWAGAASVRRSQSTVTELRYVENEPTAISFRGGFLETRRNDNVLEYTARLPEFTAAGAPTDRLLRHADSAVIATFPSTKRLVSPDLRHLRGHWAEEAIAKLFGLEVFSSRPTQFIAEQQITRAEFAGAIVAAAKAVPADPFLRVSARGATTGAGRRAPEPAPSFTDVPATHEQFAAIEEAFSRGLMMPMAQNRFSPNATITVADAAVVFIRALGLSSLASPHGAITEYADDASIPDYARDALYAAQRIGLLRGDGQGNIYPSRALTKGEAAVMLDRFVEYMREELRKDYRERMLDY